MAKKKKKGKKKKASGAGKQMLIVSSKVRAAIKSKKCMTSSEFLPALNKVVFKLIEDAAGRAKGNRRTTLRARDL